MPNDEIEELANKLQASKQVTLLGLIQEVLEQARVKLDRPVEEPAPSEKAGKFCLLNTNRAHGNRDHDWMLAGGRAAARACSVLHWKPRILSAGVTPRR